MKKNENRLQSGSGIDIPMPRIVTGTIVMGREMLMEEMDHRDFERYCKRVDDMYLDLVRRMQK